MKRKTKAAAVLLALLALASPLHADHHDISLSFGHQSGGVENPDGINLGYGLNIGLSARWELGIWGESSLTPGFFSDNALGASFSVALLGPRSTGTLVPGSAINTMLNFGVVAESGNPWGLFAPTTGYVSLTPLTLGNPVTGRRERFMEIGVSYNWAEDRFGFFFSFLKLDYYVRGSWRDYDHEVRS